MTFIVSSAVLLDRFFKHATILAASATAIVQRPDVQSDLSIKTTLNTNGHGLKQLVIVHYTWSVMQAGLVR